MRWFNACLFALYASHAAQALAQAEAPLPPPSPNSQPLADPSSSGLPEVNDDMLQPVSPPARILGSWRQALALVESRSTSVATARSRIAEASARSRLALSTSLPNINASGSVQRALLFSTGTAFTAQTGVQANVRVPFPATIWNAGVSLRQPLFALRSWYDVRTSETAIDAATLSAEDAERLALGALADAIVAVITAERLAEVSRVSLRSNLAVLDLTQRRMRLGAASAVDVLRARQEVAANRADVVAADEAVRQSREALGMALGYPESWGVAASIRVDELAADAQSVCSPLADPNQRTDVRAARLEAAVSERNARSVGYGNAPTLDLVSDLSYTTAPGSPRPVQWSIGAVLSIPIYDGGRLTAERSQNHAFAEAARQQLTEVTRRAHLQAEQAQRAVQVAEQTFAVSQQARDIAEESARLARLAFVHGTGTSFDLVDSTQRQRLAEIDVTLREFDVVQAKIAALLALSNCNF